MLPLHRNDGMELKRHLAYAMEIADFYRMQTVVKKNLSRGQNGRVRFPETRHFFFALSVQEIESVAKQAPERSPPLKRQRNDFFSFLHATPTRKRKPSGVISAGVQVNEYIAEPCIDNEETSCVLA